MSDKKEYQVVIVGAGPAGLTAGIYTARAGISTLVIGNPYESQVANLGLIENYPGYAKGVQGLELMEAMDKQTKANGAKVSYDKVISITKENGKFIVKTEEEETIEAKVVILGMGSRHRKMKIKGEEEYYAKGVSYCAVCDGALYQGKPTAVLGYGTGAVKAALYLSNISSKVYLICTKKELGAEPIYENRLTTRDNIEIHYQTRVSEISGDDYVKSFTFKSSRDEQTVDAEGIFIEYGSVPNTLLAEQLGIEVDERGYIKSDIATMETNVPGVYAIGDVVGRIKQIATAVGDGCVAAYKAQEYLEKQ